MKILVIGATGTIGGAVAQALSAKHQVIRASRHGDVAVDIDDPAAIRRMYREVGSVDAVVAAAGYGAFGPLAQISDEDFARTLNSKMMGQVNLVRYGLDAVADGGSFTLTSGILSREPSPGSAALALVNGGLEAFAKAAALDLGPGRRINVICPGWVTETLRALKMDPAIGQDAASVSRSYVVAVEGSMTGQTLLARDYA